MKYNKGGGVKTNALFLQMWGGRMEGYVDINIEAIMRQYSAYLDEIEKKASQFALKEIKKNAKKFYKSDTSANMKAKWWDTTGHIKSHIERKKSRFNRDQYVVGSTSPHAHLLEYGHVKWINGTNTGEMVPASPFIRPAEDALKVELSNIIQSVLNNRRVVVGGR